MKNSKKPCIKKERLILAGKKTYMKKGRPILGSGWKTQKGGFLPILLWFAPLALKLLDNMSSRGIKPPPP